MDKQLKFELGDFDEEDIKRFRELIEKKPEKIYSKDEMIIFDFDKEEFLGRAYPGDVNINFGIHPSAKLQELYKKKYWQGQDPNKASVIFLGLDANWDKDIEKNEAFPWIEEYLNDGVAFWRKYGVHHPFLLPEYKKKGGYKYHQGFSKLNISKEYADKVSFVELIRVPTYGKSTKCKKDYNSLIDIDYLKQLNDIIFDDRKKLVFLPKTLYEDILKIKKRMKGTDIFNFGLPADGKAKCANRMINIHNAGNTFIFITTHFSASISDEHIADMSTTIKSFLEGKEKIWWKVSYTGSWNGELVKENRYVLAKDVFEVKEVLCKYLNPYRIERDFTELEFKPTTEDNVDALWVWE